MFRFFKFKIIVAVPIIQIYKIIFSKELDYSEKEFQQVEWKELYGLEFKFLFVIKQNCLLEMLFISSEIYVINSLLKMCFPALDNLALYKYLLSNFNSL